MTRSKGILGVCGIALLVPGLAARAQAPSAFEFSIRNIMRGPELYGRPPQDVRWSADSRWIYFTWVEPGNDWREERSQYRVRAQAGAKPEKISPARMDTLGGAILTGSGTRAARFEAAAFGGDIYVVDLQTGTSRRVTQTVAAESSPVVSRDGRTVYFVRDNNVFAVELSGGLVRQLSDIRSGPAPSDSAAAADTTQRGRLQRQQRDLLESIRDRIRTDSIRRSQRLERESRSLPIRYLQRGENIFGLSVSPAGSAILVTTSSPAQGTRMTEIPRYVTESGFTEEIRGRTKVGDVPTRGRVGLLNVATGSLQWLNPFPSDTTASGFVQVLGWNGAGTHAAFYASASDNKSRILQTVNASSGALTALGILRDSAWVGGPCSRCGGWYDGGRRFWYVSEADGFAHLYTVAADGSGRRQLTSGRWEVRGVQLSPDQQWFYLQTSEVSPFDIQIFRMRVTGGSRERLTREPGKHDAVLSPNGRLLANVYSYVNRPPELFVMDNRPGAPMSRLTLSPAAEWLSFPWIEPTIVMIPASDGAQVPAHIYTPADMGAQPNGAAVIFVHGAGYLQNVGMFWSEYPREYMFNQYLASKGYVVLDLDYRASSGHGRDWRTAIYRYMGDRDLQDQVDASRYLNREHAIHPERVGIYGGSYGGFITLMALFTEPEHFGAGAALRSVTDWAHYNQGYTSNILNLPQLDTLAYRRSSPIYFAEGLQDPLLMAHGMVDVNVHFQDIVRLTQRLIELEKTDWELAVYPVEDHAFVRPSSWTDEYRRIFELFERRLPSRVPLSASDAPVGNVTGPAGSPR